MAFLIAIAIVAFVYWRLYKSNMDVPANAEQYTDEPDTNYQVVTYIQTRRGEPLPRS